MWTQPSELHHAWRLAHMEAVEAGYELLLQFENIHFGGEFLPLQHALLQGQVTRFPASHCTLSINSEATTWLLAQLAVNTLALGPSDGEPQTRALHWIGATSGMQTCVLNTLTSQAVVSGVRQGLYGDSPHVQRILAPMASLDRASVLPRQFLPGAASHPAPEMADVPVARLERKSPAPGGLAHWLGFLTALVMFLFGFTQFFLRFL